MDTSIVFSKTAKGEEEINTRKYAVPMTRRRVLILVDGKSNVAKIIEKGAGLHEIVESLEDLEKEGFIVAVETEGTMKEKLIQIAIETLGTDAEKVIKKIEKAPNTREGLESTVESCKKLVKLIIDEKKAEDLMKKCKEVLQRNSSP